MEHNLESLREESVKQRRVLKFCYTILIGDLERTKGKREDSIIQDKIDKLKKKFYC